MLTTHLRSPKISFNYREFLELLEEPVAEEYSEDLEKAKVKTQINNFHLFSAPPSESKMDVEEYYLSFIEYINDLSSLSNIYMSSTQSSNPDVSTKVNLLYEYFYDLQLKWLEELSFDTPKKILLGFGMYMESFQYLKNESATLKSLAEKLVNCLMKYPALLKELKEKKWDAATFYSSSAIEPDLLFRPDLSESVFSSELGLSPDQDSPSEPHLSSAPAILYDESVKRVVSFDRENKELNFFNKSLDSYVHQQHTLYPNDEKQVKFCVNHSTLCFLYAVIAHDLQVAPLLRYILKINETGSHYKLFVENILLNVMPFLHRNHAPMTESKLTLGLDEDSSVRVMTEQHVSLVKDNEDYVSTLECLNNFKIGDAPLVIYWIRENNFRLLELSIVSGMNLVFPLHMSELKILDRATFADITNYYAHKGTVKKLAKAGWSLNVEKYLDAMILEYPGVSADSYKAIINSGELSRNVFANCFEEQQGYEYLCQKKWRLEKLMYTKNELWLSELIKDFFEDPLLIRVLSGKRRLLAEEKFSDDKALQPKKDLRDFILVQLNIIRDFFPNKESGFTRILLKKLKEQIILYGIENRPYVGSIRAEQKSSHFNFDLYVEEHISKEEAINLGIKLLHYWNNVKKIFPQEFAMVSPDSIEITSPASKPIMNGPLEKTKTDDAGAEAKADFRKRKDRNGLFASNDPSSSTTATTAIPSSTKRMRPGRDE